MAKTWAMVFGWIFVALGVLGFISNPIVGDMDIFHADMMHNIVHIIFGAVLLWAAYAAPNKAAVVMKWEGILYLLLAVFGFVLVGSSVGSLLGLIEINGRDNWLHLVFGFVLTWAGMKADKSTAQSI